MKTKYNVGETVLLPCMVEAIAINKNGVEYQVIPKGYTMPSIELEEHELYGSMCNEEEKGIIRGTVIRGTGKSNKIVKCKGGAV